MCEVVSQFALLWPAMQWEAHVVLARVCLRGLWTSLRISMASASPTAMSGKSTSVSTSSQSMPPPRMPLVSMSERMTTQAASKRDLGNLSSLGKPPKQARTDTGTLPAEAMLQSIKDLPAELLQARRRAQNQRDIAKTAARRAVVEFISLPSAEHRLSEVRDEFDQLILDGHVDTCHAAFVDTIDAYVLSMEDIQRFQNGMQRLESTAPLSESTGARREGGICGVRSPC